MHPIKVLVISDYRETQSVRPEAELFIGLQRVGLSVTVMTFGEAAYVTRFKEAGIRVIEFHPITKFDRKETQQIRHELILGQYDILHLFNSRAIMHGIRAARGLPVKVVLYRGYEGNVHWYDPTAYLKYLHPRVDMVTCITQSNEGYMRRQFLFGSPKVRCIHKGHDLSWYKGVVPKSFGDFPPSCFKLFCVANNRPMKGVRYLLQAIAKLPTELPLHLFLIGKDMDAGDGKQLIAENPNRDKIHLLGYRTDVLELVAGADAFVLPSIKGEATTKAVIEAMAFAVPPIITSIPGNRELVLHEQCGLVVPPKDPTAIANAILRLYHDRPLRQRLGKAAQLHLEQKFNIEESQRQTIALYKELIGHKDPVSS